MKKIVLLALAIFAFTLQSRATTTWSFPYILFDGTDNHPFSLPLPSSASVLGSGTSGAFYWLTPLPAIGGTAVDLTLTGSGNGVRSSGSGAGLYRGDGSQISAPDVLAVSTGTNGPITITNLASGTSSATVPTSAAMLGAFSLYLAPDSFPHDVYAMPGTGYSGTTWSPYLLPPGYTKYPASSVNWVFLGDSLTDYAGTQTGAHDPSDSGVTYFTLLKRSPMTQGKTLTNLGVGGRHLTDILATYSIDAHLLSPAVTGCPGTLFILAGINDCGIGSSGSAIYANFVTLCGTARADGYTVVAMTIPDATARLAQYPGNPYYVDMVNLNNLIIASGTSLHPIFDFLVRFDLAVPGFCNDPYYVHGDIHQTDLGNYSLANAILQTLIYTPGSGIGNGFPGGLTGNNYTRIPAKEAFTPSYLFTTTTNSAGECVILSYNGAASIVNIPPVINGIPVTEIGNGSSAIVASQTQLVSIVIPEGVTTLNQGCLGTQHSLAHVRLPSTLTTMHGSVFCYDYALTDITIPAGITDLSLDSGYQFYGCTSLAAIRFKGNAPTGYTLNFCGGASPTIYFEPNTSGWTTPTWNGIPSRGLVLSASCGITYGTTSYFMHVTGTTVTWGP